MRIIERFEMRLTEEDRARLRALAERTSGNESQALRQLLREAVPVTDGIPPLDVSMLAAPRGGELARSAA